ncbi:hypothetical protein ACQJBY_073382 [Aegilops geniculata]
MAMPTTLKFLTILSVLVVLAADQIEGRNHGPDCSSFSCGPFEYVSSPFRKASDPPGCGSQSYELVCSDTKATIRIDDATYHVSDINYKDSTFRVVDSDLDLYSSCPLPRWKRNRPLVKVRNILGGQRVHSKTIELAPVAYSEANFVNCSQQVEHNSMYKPVACLSSSYSFVYVLTGPGYRSMENLEPSCSYLAMTPLDDKETSGTMPFENASYADVIKFMIHGFSVGFPYKTHQNFKECLMDGIL